MTHTDRGPALRRPLLGALACIVAVATMLGLRAPAARADDGVCAAGPYTIVPTGPNGNDLTQPPMSLISLRVFTSTGDPLAASCNGSPLTFDWTYQDYFTGSGPQVSVAGTSDQETVTYQVRVSVGAAQVGAGEVTLSYVDVAPVVTSISTSPAAPSTGQSTTLTSVATNPSAIKSTAWDFGDGTTSSGGTSIDHVFRLPGDYTVSVLATGWFGKTGSATQIVHVNAPLVGGFTLTPSTVGVGDTVHLDGAGASTDPAATITGYSWDFGDGTHATGPAADYAYPATGTYTVSETVSDTLGRSVTTTHDVTVQDAPPVPTGAPVAAWRVTTAAPTAASPVFFDGTGSTDDRAITAYRWTFGDGATGSGATPQHTYSAAGSYPVTLTVTDESGNTDSATHLVAVADAPPTAAFTGPASSVAGAPSSFDAAASTAPGGALTGYAWTFGDGGTATGVAPQHTFAAAGTYPVILTVTDSRGRTASALHSITVHWKATDLAVSVGGSTPKAGLYTYRVTVRNLGSAAAHAVVLLNTMDITQVLASGPSAPGGVSCAGVRIGSTGTITCKASPATVLAAGASWTVTYTVRQPTLPRSRLAVETSQVTAVNPDPISANNTARLSTSVGGRR